MLQRVKLSDALKIRNGIMFDFYPGLPYMSLFDLPLAPKLLVIIVNCQAIYTLYLSLCHRVEAAKTTPTFPVLQLLHYDW